MKVVRLLALGTGCLHPKEIFLVLISVTGRVDPMPIVCCKELEVRFAALENLKTCRACENITENIKI